MNRFIGKLKVNGGVEVVTLASGDPKRALTEYIYKFENDNDLSRGEIYRKIKKTPNKYYFNEYFISRGTK